MSGGEGAGAGVGAGGMGFLYSELLCPGTGPRKGSLYGEVQCIMGNGHMGPPLPVNRMTDVHH